MTESAALTVQRLTQPDIEDFDAIVALEGESFSNPWTAAALADMLTSPVTQLYVARQQDRRIIGFCACWLIEDELHINTVAVQPTMRRQGVATRLLTEILAATGAQTATLEVRRSNVAALKLYESLGFATTAVRPRYYNSPEEDALVLWRHP
jgi:[ribosomal protein S18]-alanine N-acetyltransferase